MIKLNYLSMVIKGCFDHATRIKIWQNFKRLWFKVNKKFELEEPEYLDLFCN